MKEPVWLQKELVKAIHDRQLAEHGGGSGVRDEGLLESALARPQQLFAYGGTDVDMPALAAACAHGIARNHAFVDGNKRTAYVSCRTFLVINGWDLVAPPEERYAIFLAMATGELSEEQFTEWLRRNTRPLDDRINEDPASFR